MLKTPTNNIGLAYLFKKFVLIGEQYQKEEVSISRTYYIFSALNLRTNSRNYLSRAKPTKTNSKCLMANCVTFRVFNTYLRLVKRIAYNCPVTHISDTFFKLLLKFIVSFSNNSASVWDMQIKWRNINRRPFFNIFWEQRMSLSAKSAKQRGFTLWWCYQEAEKLFYWKRHGHLLRGRSSP